MPRINRNLSTSWRVIDQDDLHDSFLGSDREPFPADPDANVFRASKKVGLMGVNSEDLDRAQRQYPELSQAMAFLDRTKRTRVGQLPNNKAFGEHSDHPGYHLAAITLA